MTHAWRRWTQAAVPAALVLGGLATAPVSLAGAETQGAVARDARSAMPRGSFERHLDAFDGVGATKVRLSKDGSGRKKSRAMVATRKKSGTVHVKSRSYAGDQPRKTRFKARIWVRTETSGRVALKVQERADGETVKTTTRQARVRAGRWTTIATPVVTRKTDSRLVVHVKAPKVSAQDKVLVDDVKLVETGTATATDTSGLGLTNGCTTTKRGIPSCGTLVGAAHGSNTDPSALEKQLGSRLGVRRTYYTSTQVTKAVSTAKADLALNRLPWISFKLPYSWSEMVAGKGDAWARDLANRLDALDGPVWVAFHHEPEGDGDIQVWRKMQERLAPIIRNTADNVAFTVVTTGWNQFYGDAKYSLEQIWPRNVKVDVAGFDIYQQYGVVKDGKTTTKWTDMAASYFAKIQAWAKSKGVAWGLAETGVTHAAAAARPEEIPNTVKLMETYGGDAYAYFDTTLNSIAPWDLSTTVKRNAFAKALKAAPALRR